MDADFMKKVGFFEKMRGFLAVFLYLVFIFAAIGIKIGERE